MQKTQNNTTIILPVGIHNLRPLFTWLPNLDMTLHLFHKLFHIPTTIKNKVFFFNLQASVAMYCKATHSPCVITYT